MLLVLNAYSPPPQKKYWVTENAEDRGEWIDIFESIVSWFCMSHGFRKNLNAEILVSDLEINLQGENLRYLAPSLRSVASLVYKAYQLGLKLSPNKIAESTPGVTVRNQPLKQYPKPWYHCDFNSVKSLQIISEGTLFNEIHENSKPISVPASTLAQAIVWLQYGG
ncbi:MAG: hypothetical protein ACXAD7_00025 [Candidatus Kariarchaeaceae archaeon]|jgi:hypothetical protein